MALTYHFELGFDASRVSEILEQIASLLVPAQRIALSSCLPWCPQIETEIRHLMSGSMLRLQCGIAGLPPDIYLEDYRGNRHTDICLALNVPLTPALKACALSHTFADCVVDNTLHLGCLWTTLYVGERYGILYLQAASSPISLFISHSAFKVWFAKAFSASALYLLFDDESPESELLLPARVQGGRINTENCEEEAEAEAQEATICFSVDHYVSGIWQDT